MLSLGSVFGMFRVDVASEEEVVLGAFLLVVGGVVGFFSGGFFDSELVASTACFDVDCGSRVVGCFQRLQEMGYRQV